MREILFKAKEYGGGEWVEGYFVKSAAIETKFPSVIFTNIDTEIIEGFEFTEVEENTVCQYTGLTDKNGAKIFEWDIVKTTSGRGFVNYNGGCFCVHDFDTKNNPAIDLVMLGNKIEVVGNIHDRADMRKDGKE